MILLILLTGCIDQDAACCVTLGPAELTNTFGWVGELEKDGRNVHIMAYKNSAFNLINPRKGNAMLLPIPAKPGTLSSANMLDGNDFNQIPERLFANCGKPMDEDFFGQSLSFLFWCSLFCSVLIAPRKWKTIGCGFAILLLVSFIFLFSLNSAKHGITPELEVFNRGSYTVLLTPNIASIPAALAQVSEDRRPAINREIFESYEKWYPGWSFALCCFDKNLDNPEPIVWWYEPQNPDVLFFPGLDAHTGHIPELNSLVRVDHGLVVSSYKMFTGLADTWFSPVHKTVVKFSDAAITYRPTHVMGTSFNKKLFQGDFEFLTRDVRMGILRPHRRQPPGINENLVFSLADFAMEDRSLLPKITLAYLFAAIALRVIRQAELSRKFIVLTLLICIASQALEAWVMHSMTSFVWLSPIILLVAILAISTPLVMLLPATRYLNWLSAASFLLIAFFLPGYSSAWFPLAWMAVLVWYKYAEAKKTTAE